MIRVVGVGRGGEASRPVESTGPGLVPSSLESCVQARPEWDSAAFSAHRSASCACPCSWLCSGTRSAGPGEGLAAGAPAVSLLVGPQELGGWGARGEAGSEGLSAEAWGEPGALGRGSLGGPGSSALRGQQVRAALLSWPLLVPPVVSRAQGDPELHRGLLCPGPGSWLLSVCLSPAPPPPNAGCPLPARCPPRPLPVACPSCPHAGCWKTPTYAWPSLPPPPAGLWRARATRTPSPQDAGTAGVLPQRPWLCPWSACWPESGAGQLSSPGGLPGPGLPAAQGPGGSWQTSGPCVVRAQVRWPWACPVGGGRNRGPPSAPSLLCHHRLWDTPSPASPLFPGLGARRRPPKDPPWG